MTSAAEAQGLDARNSARASLAWVENQSPLSRHVRLPEADGPPDKDHLVRVTETTALERGLSLGG